MAGKKNKTLEKAKLEMDCLTGDAEMKRLAELREKWEMDYNSGISYAKEEGRKEGLSEGISKGITEGIASGIQKAKVETTKKMLEKGMNIEDISEITGLTKKEIEKVKNQ